MLGTAFTKHLNGHVVIPTGSSLVNIVNLERVFDFVETAKPDYIINCAGYTDVDGAETNRDEAKAVNVNGAKNIALVTNTYPNIKALHIGSDYIFTGDKMKYAEIDTPHVRPLNYYGLTKLQGEELFCTHSEECFIVRTSWVFSEYGNNFVKSMLRLFNEKAGDLEKGDIPDPICIVNDQLGRPTYAPYLAEIATELLFDEDRQTGVWHVANSGICSWAQFAEEIYRQAKKIGLVNGDVLIKHITTAELEPRRKAVRPKFSVLETKRVEKYLQRRMKSWKQSLRDCLMNIKAKQSK